MTPAPAVFDAYGTLSDVAAAATRCAMASLGIEDDALGIGQRKEQFPGVPATEVTNPADVSALLGV